MRSRRRVSLFPAADRLRVDQGPVSAPIRQDRGGRSAGRNTPKTFGPQQRAIPREKFDDRTQGVSSDAIWLGPGGGATRCSEAIALGAQHPGRIIPMSPSPPPRWKDPADLTVEEHLQRRRDPQVQFESDEYRRYRDDVLKKAGLDESGDSDVPLAEMTAQQHFDRNRSRSGR